MMLARRLRLLIGLGWAGRSDARAISRLHPGVVSADPFRLVEGVVTAIGFIGARTMFRHHPDHGWDSGRAVTFCYRFLGRRELASGR